MTFQTPALRATNRDPIALARRRGSLTMRLAVLGAFAAGVFAAIFWPQERRAKSPSAGKAAPASAPAFAPGTLPYRGLAIQVASGWRPLETFTPLLDEIAALGANTVLLSVAGYMEHAKSQSIYIDARKVPSVIEFQELIRRARERGLKTLIMPIVLLRNPRGSEWRGVIEPPDWDEWWNQYNEFILYFADICREGGADGLMVGSELVSTERERERWERLIDQVRPRFWGGKLGYSANWDHYRPIEFWDKLDFIGMTSYYTLADKKGASVEEMMEKWEPIKKDVLAWQRRIGKPILFTEVGWCSQEGAATAPWNYYQNQQATPDGHEEQRRLYEAFLRVWDGTPELLGAIWWEWNAGAGGAEDFGYSPKNKPAEKLLRQWFAAGREQEEPREEGQPSTRPAAHRPRPAAAQRRRYRRPAGPNAPLRVFLP